MSTATSNYNLIKPDEEEFYNVDIPNDNMDIIDTQIKAISDNFVSHKAETAPHAELIYRTITVGTDKDFATIQGAINSLKKRVDATITINIDAGTYNEDVIIGGFVGNGRINLNGGDSLDNAVNYKVNSIYVCRNLNLIVINGIECTRTNDSAFISERTYTMFENCKVSTTSSLNGIFIHSGFAYIIGCEVSNRGIALGCQHSVVYSLAWSAGSGNTIGLRATYSSTIGKDGTQPQGSTAEQTSSGGVIR